MITYWITGIVSVMCEMIAIMGYTAYAAWNFACMLDEKFDNIEKEVELLRNANK